MKSIISLLPLAAAALAHSVCQVNTITVTEYFKPAETVQVKVAEVKPSCTKSTITTTTWEKVYVTVAAEDDEDEPPRTIDYTVDVTRTRTTTVYTTVYVSGSATYAVAKPTTTAGYQVGYNTVPPMSGSKNGNASFYGGNLEGGMCSYKGYTLPSGIFGVALSQLNWGGASNCGTCVRIKGPGGNYITAMIVDQCKDSGLNHLDLFQDGYKSLADPSKGVIPVSWDIVPCGINTPIVLRNKEGMSKSYFSIQVRNSNVAIAKLEVSTDACASWQPTIRKEYNYFEKENGYGTDAVDIRITSVDGKFIIVKGVSVTGYSTSPVTGNFY